MCSICNGSRENDHKCVQFVSGLEKPIMCSVCIGSRETDYKCVQFISGLEKTIINVFSLYRL